MRRHFLHANGCFHVIFIQPPATEGSRKRSSCLKELFSAFPDAVVVHTHRNPLEVLRSSLQLTSVLRGLFGRPGDPGELREHEARVLAEMMDRSIRFRDRHREPVHQ